MPWASAVRARREHDELESCGGEHLGRGRGLLHRLRPDPEESLEIDAGGGAELRIEMIADVDQRGRLSDRSRGGQRGHDDREAQAASGHLRDLPSCQPPVEECVDGGDGRRQRLLAPAALERADQLRAAGQTRRNGGLESGTKALDGLRGHRLYRRWIRYECWPLPNPLVETEKLELKRGIGHHGSHGSRLDNVGGNRA